MSSKRLIRTMRRYAVFEFAAYALLAVLATWPLATRIRSSLALGTEPAATVPLFTTWTIWWNADRSASLYHQYWDVPIFQPVRCVFAFSEPMPTTIAVAPIIWATGDRLLAHNTFLLLSLVLNGWSTFMLLRGLRLQWLPCALGGAAVEFLPFVHHQLGVLQLVPLCGIVWTVHALYLLGRRPTMVRAALLSAAFAFTYLTCAYYGLFLSLLLILAFGWLIGRRLARVRTWLTLAAAAAISLLLIGPVVWSQLGVVREHDFDRPPDLVGQLSAESSDYLVSPWPQVFEPSALRQMRNEASFPLCPGFLKLGLAFVGVVGGLVQNRYRCWTAFCLTVFGLAFVLSMGPKFHVAGLNPYTLLMDWYPGFAQARNAFRFAIFVQLVVVLLAALGLHAIGTFAIKGPLVGGKGKQRGSQKHSKRHFVASALTAVIGLLAIAEIRPPRQEMFSVPPLETHLGWIEWLRLQTPDDSVIACIPFPQGKKVWDYEETMTWVYWGTFHKRRMVNGYSGFFPGPFLELKKAMQNFPDEASLRMLKQRDVDYCVVRRSFLTRRAVVANQRLVWTFGDDEAQIDVYRLVP